MRAVAPAKINWTLEVLGRRDDGYHEIRSVMQTIELCDWLDIEPAAAISLTVAGPHTPSEYDLVLRAANLLSEEAAPGRGAAIHLTKRIPLAAGLGGGSSDAAATLRALNQMWTCGLPAADLASLACRVGSDVAFFLHGGTALAEGRGECVTPLPDAPESWLVVVVPPITMEDKTKRMYAALTPADFTDGSGTSTFAKQVAAGRAPDLSLLHNAFDTAADAVFHRLSVYREGLLRAGAASVHLAGAGPALFALTSGEVEARAIRKRLDSSLGKSFVARTLPAAEATALDA